MTIVMHMFRSLMMVLVITMMTNTIMVELMMMMMIIFKLTRKKGVREFNILYERFP